MTTHIPTLVVSLFRVKAILSGIDRAIRRIGQNAADRATARPHRMLNG